MAAGRHHSCFCCEVMSSYVYLAVFERHATRSTLYIQEAILKWLKQSGSTLRCFCSSLKAYNHSFRRLEGLESSYKVC